MPCITRRQKQRALAGSTRRTAILQEARTVHRVDLSSLPGTSDNEAASPRVLGEPTGQVLITNGLDTVLHRLPPSNAQARTTQRRLLAGGRELLNHFWLTLHQEHVTVRAGKWGSQYVSLGLRRLEGSGQYKVTQEVYIKPEPDCAQDDPLGDPTEQQVTGDTTTDFFEWLSDYVKVHVATHARRKALTLDFRQALAERVARAKKKEAGTDGDQGPEEARLHPWYDFVDIIHACNNRFKRDLLSESSTWYPRHATYKIGAPPPRLFTDAAPLSTAFPLPAETPSILLNMGKPVYLRLMQGKVYMATGDVAFFNSGDYSYALEEAEAEPGAKGNELEPWLVLLGYSTPMK